MEHRGGGQAAHGNENWRYLTAFLVKVLPIASEFAVDARVDSSRLTRELTVRS
jgi:hypothetical protein